MNVKVNIWIIIFILGLSAVILASVYFLFFSRHEAGLLNDQRPGNNNFSDFLTAKKKLPQTNEEVSLIAVGDISYSRGVESVVKKEGNINYPFFKIGDYLKDADIVFGNLETPIIAGREIPTREMVFRSNPGTEQALRQANFSVLSLANNHTPNFGAAGLKNTLDYLDEAGIKHAGAGENEEEAGEPAYIEAKGIKFAFLAYNDNDVVPASYEAGADRAGTVFMRREKMAAAVAAAKKQANFVIVSMHSGTEYVGEPNSSQVNFAHAAVDAGADLIIGHHPHVVQTMEEYKGKYIFYSLGNFVFDQPWSRETKEGLAVKIYFNKDGVNKIFFLPVVSNDLVQPETADKAVSEKILSRLKFPLIGRDIYFWDGQNFKKDVRFAVYTENYETSGSFISKQSVADLDNNSVEEIYVLENGRLTITENAAAAWQSPADWWIDNFILADLNNDGMIDINLSLWKAGDFGSSKPFWVEENDMSVKNHFFMLDFVGRKIKPVWASSNLGVPNCEFNVADIDGDGRNDLIVLEGDYAQEPACAGNYVAVWKWNGWGFSNEWRSELGHFSDLGVEKNDEKSYIIVGSF